MKTTLLLLLLSMNVLAMNALADQSPVLFSSLKSFTYSDNIPIEQMINSLEGSKVGNSEYAFTHNQLDIGVAYGAFEFSVFNRYDYYLKYSADTARLFYLENNDLPIERGRSYSIDLSANELLSKGFAVAYSFESGRGIKSKIKASYLRAQRTTNGRLWGDLAESETGSTPFSGNINLDYSYTEDKLLSRPQEDFVASGVTIDFAAEGQFSEGFYWQLSAKDLFSAIYWEDITYTKAKATSDIIRFDDDGRIDTIPTLSGIESYRNDVQRLPIQIDLSLAQTLTPLAAIEYGVFAYDDLYFPRVAMATKYRGLRYRAAYEFNSRAVQFDLESNHIVLQLKADSSNRSSLETFGLGLAYRMAF